MFGIKAKLKEMRVTHLNKYIFLLVGVALFGSNPAWAQFLTREEYEAKVAPSPVNVYKPPMTRPVLTPPDQFKKTPEEKEKEQKGDSAPVDFQADNLQHNEKTQIITATGNVELLQSGRMLRADKIVYNLKTDTVKATGNVELHEVNGDIHTADSVELVDEMKNGFVEGLQSFLADGSRFVAAEGERQNGVETIMHDASYTPCEPCEENPDADPVWQIRAARVKHDKAEHRISYNHARFEVYGVPVAYTPYFSHPDGTIKRKSGFLSPSGGYKSDLGAFIENSYYWNIAPDKDATIGLLAMTEEDPMAFAQYRQRWNKASLIMDGSITNSGRTERINGVDVDIDEETRGHLFADGLWNIDNKWRAGLDLELTSDDQYLNQYDFSSKDILENELYLERFSGRNYAVGRLLSFRDVRVEQDQVDQPNILPEIVVSYLGEPDSVPVLGGRWSVDGSFLGLNRNGDDQDMNRISGTAGWKRRLVSNTGLVTTVDASLRGDLYNVQDRAIATAGSGRSRDASASQFFPSAHIQTSYPLAKNLERTQWRVEPIASVTFAPNIDVNDNIPNEDSQDVQIDASNLFEPNRFPGLDRIEDKTHAAYGMKTGLYGYDGSFADIFLGQSIRFDSDDNPFPEGSGLNNQQSDYVGQIALQYQEKLRGNYRFQLDNNSFASQRHEADIGMDFGRFSLGTRYLFAKALEGTNINESREQIQADAGYYLTPEWRIHTGGKYDFGQDQGLRESYIGLDYFGQCISWSLTGERNLTDDSSGESDTEIVFRIGLKNLGEFVRSGLRQDAGRDYR